VTALIRGSGVKRLVDIAVDDDGKAATPPAVITATEGHPFWVPARGEWVNAGSLAAGSAVLTGAGKRASITSVSERTRTTTVYNLSVAGIHTFYVMAGKAAVLVHNSGPFCGIPFGRAPGTDEFHASGYSLDEMVQFVFGHTGGGNPAMGRPTSAEVEDVLRSVGPQQIPGQNSAVMIRGNVRVIINYSMPWRSTANYIR
jgi:hypothetical protein